MLYTLVPVAHLPSIPHLNYPSKPTITFMELKGLAFWMLHKCVASNKGCLPFFKKNAKLVVFKP